MHTKRFVGTEITQHSLGRTQFAEVETVRHNGQVIGYDSIEGRFLVKQGIGKLNVAVALRGGIILARVTVSNATPAFSGTITGGRGKYRGITGTVTGRSMQGNKERVTLHYHW